MVLSLESRQFKGPAGPCADSLETIRQLLGISGIRSGTFVEALPFSLDDTTAGSETELQAAVQGERRRVDLPITIETSNYYSNIIKRAASGDSSQQAITDLEKYLNAPNRDVWENSWVRLPVDRLSPLTKQILEADLRADRKDPGSGRRNDAGKFFFRQSGREHLRIPVSYLLKLSLAEFLGTCENLPAALHVTGRRLMDHLLSDNTSPETFSFHVVPISRETGSGRALAKETAKRYLLTQLLVTFANNAFGLKDGGQKALLYLSPHPPVRQKQLNEFISDSFYRQLFMSPCLSGWDNGEEKHDYMCLCHQVLSRSQLNATAKLRDAGIITRNLVVLPNLSNISLANNGTHISLGSRKLTGLLADDASGFTRAHEKHLGDLVIKIVEHFLPLFVGTYSAAPYRIDFSDFHPERVLGFLPHELDFTHLRMIWRRWKRKAGVKVFGRPLTPFGVKSVDRVISLVFRLKGDFVPDFRLVDYLVSLMGTDSSPAMDGTLGNGERLKKDLSDLGIFDPRMSLYFLYRLREFAQVGFSGFEGRYYSLFESLDSDVSHSVNLQILITALAYKYALQGRFTHGHIPDDPQTESERRQIFFGAAIGLPTFFVRRETRNLFMKTILERTGAVRYSRRYPGYLRVYNRQYKLALVDLMVSDAADLIELLDLKETIRDLRLRLEDQAKHSTAGRLTRAILDSMGQKEAMKVRADDFNLAAEKFYREDLKRRHIAEALEFVREDLEQFSVNGSLAADRSRCSELLSSGDGASIRFVDSVQDDLLKDTISPEDLSGLLKIVLATVHDNAERARSILIRESVNNGDSASIHRAQHG